MGSRAGLDGGGKFRLSPGFDPRTVQPVASRFTYWDIPAQAQKSKEILTFLYTMISFLRSFAYD